jgi:phosphotransacetylase/acyl dehydratase
MEYIENRTFDEIKLGDTATLTRTLSQQDIELFAVMSGDVNPAHLDQEYARSDMFHKIIAHGMWGASLISTLLGTRLPGPGAIYLGQTLRFLKPVAVGDTITVTVTVTAMDDARHRVTFDCTCANQNGDLVISGTAEVLAPTEKVKRPRIVLPEVLLHDHGAQCRWLIDLARGTGMEPVRMAIVHPVDRATLVGATDAAQANLIIPVLVGPEARIQAAGDAAGIDLSQYTIVPTEHSHAAATQAVAMARKGEVDALMQGSLQTDELMQAVTSTVTATAMVTTTAMAAGTAPNAGLGTGRLMSHVHLLDVPTYPRPLLLTDAALNIYPDVEAKRQIVQNAIDLAHALGIASPRVAILSAVETVNPRIQSTLDAAALCKMADRGQISGGVLDGPLEFDSAVSVEAARIKGINSPVAGKADILVAPDLEGGEMLAKQLEYLADA